MGLHELKIFDSEVTRGMMKTLQAFPSLRKLNFIGDNYSLGDEGAQHMTSGITLLTALLVLVFEQAHDMGNGCSC